ncbi:hypothetical protein Moror_1395 [Moniliophthora roreri MCA 2997]|uniref:Uncharacterized protein n=1 Tax=Moniliophthora roreri (strain MCA 2997) TaxID=1381753 RepID=V2WQP9_MONRO|nr:hypothetical protein Moror_1395 [Moniliophthora roreri MCA 2997]
MGKRLCVRFESNGCLSLPLKNLLLWRFRMLKLDTSLSLLDLLLLARIPLHLPSSTFQFLDPPLTRHFGTQCKGEKRSTGHLELSRGHAQPLRSRPSEEIGHSSSRHQSPRTTSGI